MLKKQERIFQLVLEVIIFWVSQDGDSIQKKLKLV